MESSGGLLTIVVSVLLASCFVKIFTTLTILRCGLGLWQWEFGIPIFALALALTAYGMEPYVSLSEFLTFKDLGGIEKFHAKVEPFLRSNTDPGVYNQLQVFKKDRATTLSSEENPLCKEDYGLLIASFLVSQLKEAFSIGFLLLVPFLVVDVVVMNLLMILGTREFNPDVVSIPLKILLFFSVDGWTLLAEKLLQGGG